mgnify:CR=1 FL=1
MPWPHSIDWGDPNLPSTWLSQPNRWKVLHWIIQFHHEHNSGIAEQTPESKSKKVSNCESLQTPVKPWPHKPTQPATTTASERSYPESGSAVKTPIARRSGEVAGLSNKIATVDRWQRKTAARSTKPSKDFSFKGLGAQEQGKRTAAVKLNVETLQWVQELAAAERGNHSQSKSQTCTENFRCA